MTETEREGGCVRYVCMCVSVYVCVLQRERKREEEADKVEKEMLIYSLITYYIFFIRFI